MWLTYSCIAVAIIFGFTGLFMWDNSKDVRISVSNEQFENNNENDVA